jgi:uncharacterized RDD family membrane protein YckC
MAYPITTEAPDPTKVMGRRVGAFIIDLIIGLALLAGVSRATVEGVVFEDVNLCANEDAAQLSENEFESCTISDNRFAVFSNDETLVINLDDTWWVDLAALIYGLMVLVGIQGLTGATPGKAVVGIRTVNAAGQKPGIGRALVRWVLWIVDWFPYCCLPLVGGIAALSSKGHKRVGDMVAKTYVIDRGSRGRPVTYPGQPGGVMEWTPQGGAAPASAIPGAPPMPGAVATAAPPTPGASEPTWDPQRNQYVQYDQATGRWLAHDDQTNEWKPIE